MHVHKQTVAKSPLATLINKAITIPKKTTAYGILLFLFLVCLPVAPFALPSGKTKCFHSSNSGRIYARFK